MLWRDISFAEGGLTMTSAPKRQTPNANQEK